MDSLKPGRAAAVHGKKARIPGAVEFAAFGRDAALPAYTKTDMIGDRDPRPLYWLGSSRDELRRFPEQARRVAGFQLRRVQHGLLPSDWKPMPSIGHGVREIRVHAGMEHRVVFVARFLEAVYVLHAFQKSTRKTSSRDIEICRVRLKELIQSRELE
jgi:phage-related protein